MNEAVSFADEALMQVTEGHLVGISRYAKHAMEHGEQAIRFISFKQPGAREAATYLKEAVRYLEAAIGHGTHGHAAHSAALARDFLEAAVAWARCDDGLCR